MSLLMFVYSIMQQGESYANVSIWWYVNSNDEYYPALVAESRVYTVIASRSGEQWLCMIISAVVIMNVDTQAPPAALTGVAALVMPVDGVPC